jgi:hypothetical protein
MNSLNKKKIEIEKGCGKNLGHWNCGEKQLGDILYLCPTCQAQLSILNFAITEFDNFVLKLKEENNKHIWSISANKIIDKLSGVNNDKM